VLFVSGCGSVASFLMMLVTTTMPGLLAARALGGVAAAGETVAQALLTDGVSASDHPSAIATLGAVRGAGTLFGPLLGALVAFTLPSNPFGGAIVLSVVLACIPLLMTAAYMRRHPHQPSVVKLSGAPDRDQAAPPTVRTRVWTAIGLTGFIAVPTALLITVAPIFIQRVYGAGPGETGLLLSSGVVAVILSRLLLLPVLVRRLGVWARLATTAVLTALGAAAAPYQSSLVAFGVAMSVLAVGASGALTFTSAFVAEVAPVARRGEFLGWNAAAYSLMIVVSALAGGVLFDRLGPGAPFLIGVGSAVAATVLAVASGVLSCPRH
jgi:MFS family permease